MQFVIIKVYHDHYDDGPRYGYHTFHVPKYDYQDRGHEHYKERLAYIKVGV